MTYTTFLLTEAPFAKTTELTILYMLLGGILTFFGITGRITKYYLLISEPMLSLILGLLCGEFFKLYGAVLNPHDWFTNSTLTNSMLQLTRATSAIQLMSTALRIPRFFVVFAWKQLLVLLFPVFILTALTGALFVWGVFSGSISNLGYLVPLMLGASCASTDPVIATTAVTSAFAERSLSEGFRQLISTESAAIDGMVYLFVTLPLLFSARPDDISAGQIFKFWGIKVVLYEILLCSLIAIVIGLIVGVILEFVEMRPTDKSSFLTFTFGFSIFILGFFHTLQMSDIFAVFVAGTALIATYPHHKLKHDDSKVQEGLDTSITCIFFFILGVVTPWEGIFQLGWRGVVASLMIIFLRRFLWIWLSFPVLMPYLRSFPGEGIFFSFFAPVGVSTVFYGALSAETLHHHGQIEMAGFVWYFTVEVVIFSTFLHGFTGAGLTHIVGPLEAHKRRLYQWLHLSAPCPFRGVLEKRNLEHMTHAEQSFLRLKHGAKGGKIRMFPGRPLVGVMDLMLRRAPVLPTEDFGT